MKHNQPVLAFSFTLICLTVVSVLIPLVSCQTSPPNQVNPVSKDQKLTIDMFVYVDSIDYVKKEATVHFSILIYTATNASQIGINFENDANGYIMCERISTDQSFFGEKKIDNWPLRGSGEAYPFDNYRVNIAISR
jgi:hypothetical protein